MASVTGIENAFTTRFKTERTVYGYKLATCLGIAIVDRSNYVDALAAIYGDDAASDIKGKQIAQAITDASMVWHKAICAQG